MSMETCQWNPVVALRVVADAPDELRACDVQRLADICGAEHWPTMRAWLREFYKIICPRVKGEIEKVEPDIAG